MSSEARFTDSSDRTSVALAFLSSDLERLFQNTFVELNCQLRGGAAEPLYSPRQNAAEPDVIYYTRDYYASALHEVAHWCIAGDKRRRHVDYGYWYAPDGRTLAQQQAFEQVEIKPQALEWLFHLCCGHRFQISADNLEGDVGAGATFIEAVTEQARIYVSALRNGGALPASGRRFALALRDFYGQTLPRKEEVLLR